MWKLTLAAAPGDNCGSVSFGVSGFEKKAIFRFGSKLFNILIEKDELSRRFRCGVARN